MFASVNQGKRGCTVRGREFVEEGEAKSEKQARQGKEEKDIPTSSAADRNIEDLVTPSSQKNHHSEP